MTHVAQQVRAQIPANGNDHGASVVAGSNPAVRQPEPMRVILDGQFFRQGHCDAWRAGVITSAPETRGTDTYVDVECPPRGRERKPRRIQAHVWHLLRDTAEVRAKLAAQGIDPDKQR